MSAFDCKLSIDRDALFVEARSTFGSKKVAVKNPTYQCFTLLGVGLSYSSISSNNLSSSIGLIISCLSIMMPCLLMIEALSGGKN